ncbi:MAG: nucleotidyltransferase domain-containing protein [archaeon]|nr:nucleotidyltransferase domain-containing protein [archaeon]
MIMMKVHAISGAEKEEIKRRIVDVLEKRTEILFAYLHGSFLEENFRDIDAAIYVTELDDKRDVLAYELGLERVLEEAIRFPIDVRILNAAPLAFRFKVIKDGILLFSKDERVRCDFESLTLVEHHDFAIHEEAYRREALGIIR